jgi:phosphoribosylanthranilate isomerase/indole-3-glycerol phosphate synthase/phosphoribosylanthranilate isomerase
MSEILPQCTPQIKICGLTTVEESLACAELGADAIGCVFYPPSPRFVTDHQAKEICSALPASVWSVGVFVNNTLSEILTKVKHCGLRAVQLHGQETQELVEELQNEGVAVIKALFINGRPAFSDAPRYQVRAFLAECAGERLPGGSGKAWNWSLASALSREHPLILAGGLTPEDVAQAVRDACPDAVDVSSGVESRPGKKDLHKVRDFLDAVRHSTCRRRLRTVFQ